MDYLLSDPNYSVLQNTLRAWHNDASLTVSPLMALKLVEENRRIRTNAADALRKTLLDAISDLKPDTGEADWMNAAWRPYLIFHAQIIDRWSHTKLITQLAVSKSEYYRLRRKALASLAAALAARERDAQHRARRNLRAKVLAEFPTLLPMREADCFVGREEMNNHIKQELLDGLEKRRTTRIAIYGLPGVGKSSLAVELADDLQIQDASSGVIWLNAGKGAMAERLLLTLANVVRAGSADRTDSTIGSHIEAISETLAGQPIVLFVDDVWDINCIRPLTQIQGVAVLVITTRLPMIAHDTAITSAIHVPELTSEDCLTVFRHYAPEIVNHSRSEVEELARLCGGLPMAVALAAKRLRRFAYGGQEHRALQVVKSLRDRSQRLALREDSEPSARSLEAMIETSVADLDERHRKALARLSALAPGPHTFSLDAFIAITTEDSEVMDDLTDLGLVEPQLNDRYRLHQCLADYFLDNKECDAECQLRASAYFTSLAITNRVRYTVLAQELPNILQALRVAQEVGWNQALIEAGCVTVDYMHSVGLLGEAMDWASRIDEASAQLGYTTLVVRTGCLRAKVCLDSEQVADAERLFRRAIDAASQSNVTEELPAAYEGLAKIARRRKDVDSMKHYAELAVKAAEVSGQSVFLPRLLAMQYAGERPGGDHEKPGMSQIGRLLRSPAMRGWMFGFTLYVRGHPQRAERVLQSALQQAHDSGTLSEEFTIRAFLSVVLLALSRFDECEQMAVSGLALKEHVLLPRSLGFCYLSIGHTRYVHGQSEEGIQRCLNWHGECIRVNRLESAALALLEAANCALLTDSSLSSAIAWSQDCLGLLKLTNQSEFVPFPLAIAALAHARLGNLAEAQRLYEQSERLMTLDYAQSMPVRATWAEALLMDRQYVRAEQLCRDLSRAAHKFGRVEVEADALFFLAQSLVAQNQSQEALVQASQAYELYVSMRHFRHSAAKELLQKLASRPTGISIPMPQTLQSARRPVDRSG